jgi:lambda family phage minor tail protein L|tara:strand:+ start:567 stop:1190 length:624 start_codon:yes stop_codon:yes gene_type:complete
MAIPFVELNKINPSSIIELFELELTVGKHIATGNPQNLPTVYRFHAGANLDSFGEIIFQSNSYQRVIVKVEGLERRTTGVLARPIITFSNLGGIKQNPSTGTLITMSDFLQIVNNVTPNNDLIGAKITRKMPLASALDNSNFASGTNPFGTPSADRLRDEIFVIDRKAVENRQIVQFELTAANDLENRLIPQRVVTRDLFPAVGTFV